jgi:hypothetical protein
MSRSRPDRWSPQGGVTLWPTGRRWIAGLAMTAAAGTSVVAIAVLALTTGDADDGRGFGGPAITLAIAHVLATAWALLNPRLLPLQVVVGAALAASPVAVTDATAVGVVPVVAGVVATAELLGVCGRLSMVVPRDPTPDRDQVGLATAAAAVVSALALGVGALTSASGLVAVLLGAGACAGLAVLLVQGPGDDDPAPRSRG